MRRFFALFVTLLLLAGSISPSNAQIKNPSRVAGTGIKYYSPSASVPFNPASLSPSGWWDASDISTFTFSGSNVTAWASKVGGINAIQASGPNQPLYSATARNGKPGVIFDGTDDSLNISSAAGFPTGSAAATVAAVGYGNNTGSNQIWFFYGNVAAGQGRVLGYSNTAKKAWTGNVGQNDTASAEDWYLFDRVVISVEPAGTNPAIYLTVDGGAPQGTPTGVGTPSVVANQGRLGNLPGLTFLNGTMQEVLIFNSALGTSDRQKVEGYLAWKWGLQAQLAVSNPYFSAPPLAALADPFANFATNDNDYQSMYWWKDAV